MNSLYLLAGTNLFPDHSSLGIKEGDSVALIEARSLGDKFRYHKLRLVHLFSCMRAHADSLSDKYDVRYSALSEQGDYAQKLSNLLSGFDQLVTYQIEDKYLQKIVEEVCDEQSVALVIKDSPQFMLSLDEFYSYREEHSGLHMNHFYLWHRKKTGILVSGGKPAGGDWNYDSENRKKLPKNHNTPSLPSLDHPSIVDDVSNDVEKFFPDNPGSVVNLWLPVTRQASLDWLKIFFKERFENFGPYEDAFEPGEPFLYHSCLSALLNVGLLTPQEVVDHALKYYDKNDVHLPSVEGFIRQIIGWREFVRGVYHTEDLKQNYFGHTRKLTRHWYEGTTGIEPLDEAINNVMKYSYAHHIERLMVIGNLMLLCEVDPDEVYRWFMELFIDAYDWVMLPNVYGMSQYATGSLFATKPYISGSNYVKKMSHYNGDWDEIWDGLYWRFISVNKETFKSNHRMSMMVSMLDRMDDDKRQRIFGKANAFIGKITDKA